MPKGWQQAVSGEKERTNAPMECKCGHEWTCTGGPGTQRITKRLLSGNEYYYSQACPKCGTWCRSYRDEKFAQPSGRKPTKRILGQNHAYHIHGRDKMLRPADLADVVEESNRLLEENGYDVTSGEAPPADGAGGTVAEEEVPEE